MRPYDFNTYALIIAGNIITEFFDGTAIEVEKPEDDFTEHVGAGGDVALARNRHEIVQITFTLQQTSPSNDVLSSLLEQHKATNVPPGAALLKDSLGTTVVGGDSCWITKPSNVGLAAGEVSGRTWVVKIPRGGMFVGSSPTV